MTSFYIREVTALNVISVNQIKLMTGYLNCKKAALGIVQSTIAILTIVRMFSFSHS